MTPKDLDRQKRMADEVATEDNIEPGDVLELNGRTYRLNNVKNSTVWLIPSQGQILKLKVEDLEAAHARFAYFGD
jgi:Lhr-like helicase